jgi:hypothetical protein
VSSFVFSTVSGADRRVFDLPYARPKPCHFLLLGHLPSDRSQALSRPSEASRRAALAGGCDPYNNDGGNGRPSSLPVGLGSRCRPASIRIFHEPV